MKLYELNATLEDGTNYSFEQYKGNVLLIVNTASKCGFTPQFDGLEKLYQDYEEKGLVVLGFPSNQFKQELASAEQAAEQCRLQYGVTFPMHEIVDVNGKNAHPVFQYLTENSKGLLGSKIKWNFTKFLIDRDGNLVKRYGSTDKPEAIAKDIEKIL